MPTASARPTGLRVGLALFLVGLVFLVATVVPFFFGSHNRSLWLNLGCLLVPLGFIVAVSSAVRAGREDQRAALQGLVAPADEAQPPDTDR
jgi:hypothetical protein